MKRIVSLGICLIGLNSFSRVNSEIFSVTYGFGVRNQSTHVSYPDWNRYFLSTDKGVVESFITKSGSRCKSIILGLDSNSSRFYNKMTINYELKPTNSMAATCDSFARTIIELSSRVSAANPAKIAIERNQQGLIQKIVIQFENKMTAFF